MARNKQGRLNRLQAKIVSDNETETVIVLETSGSKYKEMSGTWKFAKSKWAAERIIDSDDLITKILNMDMKTLTRVGEEYTG